MDLAFARHFIGKEITLFCQVGFMRTLRVDDVCIAILQRIFLRRCVVIHSELVTHAACASHLVTFSTNDFLGCSASEVANLLAKNGL